MQVHYPKDEGGQVKVVTASELDFLTTQGWRLVFSYQDTTHASCMETEPTPPGYQGYNCNGTIQVTRYKPNATTYFVLHKTESQVIEELNQRAANAEHETSEARRQRDEAKKALEDLTKEHQTLKNTSSFDAQRLKNVGEERDRFRTTSSKLEADLAKVRTAIGERQFNEILPPPAPKP